jgi:hypothetical protein
VLKRLRAISGSRVSFAEPEMAVGDERTHAELLVQRESLPVVAVGPRNVGRTLMRGNLAEEAEGPRLVPR